jgi:hypothetical protein
LIRTDSGAPSQAPHLDFSPNKARKHTDPDLQASFSVITPLSLEGRYVDVWCVRDPEGRYVPLYLAIEAGALRPRQGLEEGYIHMPQTYELAEKWSVERHSVFVAYGETLVFNATGLSHAGSSSLKGSTPKIAVFCTTRGNDDKPNNHFCNIRAPAPTKRVAVQKQHKGKEAVVAGGVVSRRQQLMQHHEHEEHQQQPPLHGKRGGE